MPTSAFQSFKLTVVHATDLSKDALHVHVGLLAFLVAAAGARRRIGTWLPVTAAVVVAVLGELLDMRDDLRTFGYWRWRSSLHDVVNTSFWPLAITALARTRLFGRPG